MTMSECMDSWREENYHSLIQVPQKTDTAKLSVQQKKGSLVLQPLDFLGLDVPGGGGQPTSDCDY